MNCLTYCYNSWKRPINWLRNLRQFFRNIKWAYQRVTKGYCDYDLWDMDMWLSHLLNRSLIDFANKVHGYPDSLVENEHEWKSTLYNMSTAFKNCNIEKKNFTTDEFFIQNKDKAFDMLKKYFYYLWD